MVSQRTLILECDSDRASLGIFSCTGLQLGLQQLAVDQFPAADPTFASYEAGWLKHLQSAFCRLRRRAKFRGPAILVLPAHFCLTKFIKLPRVDAIQREKILRFEAEQNIPYALTDVVWSSVTVVETATEADVLLVAVKLEILDAICGAANEAGFEIQAVVPAQCATLAGFKLAAENRRESFLGVNIGDRTTTLVLVDASRYALRTFVLGGNDGATMKEPGSGEPLIAKLQDEIARSLLHFQWRTGMTKPGRVYLAGNGARFPGLVEAVSMKLGLPVERCDWRRVFDGDQERRKAGGVEGDSAASLVDLGGAAATHFDHRHAKINLLPPRLLERASYRRRRPWLVAAALLAMLVLLPPAFHFLSLRDEAIRKSAAIERELAPLRARDSRIRKNLQRLTEVRERIDFYQATGERQDAWLRLLTGLQMHLGEVEDVWLEKLQLAPAAANAPMKLMVSARMLDRTHPLEKVSPETFSRVNGLLARLAHVPLIAAVESERFDNRQPGVLQFDFVLVTDAQHPL